MLFLFDDDEKLVGKYYISKKLQGQSPSQLLAQKDNLYFFESWYPEKSTWVPCVSVFDNNPLKDLASKAVSFSNNRTNTVDLGDEELSSEVTSEDLANAWTDEFGVKYSTDRKRLFKAPPNIVDYSIKSGTKVICDKAFYFIRSLKRIFIPDSVVLIGKEVFDDCSYLESIEVDKRNLIYDSRNNCNVVIETSSNTLLYGILPQ